MKTSCLIFMLLGTWGAFAQPASSWTDLLDRDMSHWRTYLSYRHQQGYKGNMPVDSTGKAIDPIGYDQPGYDVFSIVEEQGEPVLKVSGEIYGCAFTKTEYENYHLQVKVRWGTRKWPPREQEPKDAGILYHSIGACGVDYWRSWMLSQEFQIIEGGMGDYWNIATSIMDITATKSRNAPHFRFDPKAPKVPFGSTTGTTNYCQALTAPESHSGEWNTLDLYCFKDKSVYVVNGQMVMALSGSRYQDERGIHPLTKGRIQLQSEAAEVFYKGVRIRTIGQLPASFLPYFK